MLRIFLSRFYILICTVFVISCGGGSDSGNAPPGGGTRGDPYNELEEIEGVYLGSIARNAGCTVEEDENYIAVTRSGDVLWFDYEGDACGSGENCYTEMTNPPAYTPGLLQETSDGLEAKLNPVFGDATEWGAIVFSAGVLYEGLSFEAVDPSTGMRIDIGGNTEQPFGTKVTNPSLSDIQSQLCE